MDILSKYHLKIDLFSSSKIDWPNGWSVQDGYLYPNNVGDCKNLNETITILESLGQKVYKKTETFKIKNFSCASCANSTQTTIRQTCGVLDANANFATEQITISYLPEWVNPKDFKSSLQKTGFDLILNESAYEPVTNSLQRRKRELIGAGSLAIPLLIIGMVFMHTTWSKYVTALLATPLVFYFGRNFFITAFKKVRYLIFSMETLVALSVGVSYSFSLYQLFFSLKKEVYFESAGAIVFFVLLGKYLEEKAKLKAKTSLELNLFDEKQQVQLLKENKVLKIDAGEVRVGDLVRFIEGQQVIFDSEVVQGEALVQTQWLTGETLPELKTLGSNILGGSLIRKGNVNVLVKARAKDSQLAQIQTRITEAMNSKPSFQKKVDQITQYFVPIILVISVLCWVSWAILGKNSTQGFESFITILVVACPCALGLATPMALIVGLGRAVASNILIRNAEVLEKALEIDTLIFDKTGTLTTGKVDLKEVQWVEKNEQMLYNLENQSLHPYAEAIMHNISPEAKSLISLDRIENRIGMGIEGWLNGEVFWIGNREMAERNKYFPQNEWNSFNIFFGKNKQLLAAFQIEDSIKSSASDAIITLQESGLDLYILSGDNKTNAENIAKQLGIKQVKGHQKPEDKLENLKKLKAQHRKVAMIGDGINDSPALAEADLSISFASGADVAQNVSDIILLKDDLGLLSKAIRLAQATHKTLKANLFWAFLYNLLAIPIAGGALFTWEIKMTPMIAAITMSMSSVFVVGNSLMLKVKKI